MKMKQKIKKLQELKIYINKYKYIINDKNYNRLINLANKYNSDKGTLYKWLIII
jgi:hypothetical protein